MAKQTETEQPAAEQRRFSFADFLEQGDTISGLEHTLRTGTFVHAYLISGMSGVGKRTLAGLIAQYLLCTCDHEEDGFLSLAGMPPKEKPCGTCPGCVQVLSGSHPDVVRLGRGAHISTDSKDQTKKGIVIGDIREAVRIAGCHTYEGGYRVIIVDEADTMNQQAQNCLLKTLEEPQEGTVFLLLTDSPSLLLPTIVSRCRHVRLHSWPDSKLLRILEEHRIPEERRQQVLRVCGGSIGRALEVAADEQYWERRANCMRDFFALQGRSGISKISDNWKDKKDQYDQLLDDIEDLIHALLMVRLGRLPKAVLQEYPQAWQHMAAEAGIDVFTRLLDAVHEARMYRKNQVNPQAVLDRLQLRLMEEKSRW